ncbi:GNAT family N-acetyltransferase [Priestia flexa]|uniref:GNAT family N-acetyltransferase n=1 Tax=Priestia flexa TaxID=86664 RepID=UPI0014312C7E|nr:GNAT family N-acetyltransferase [Priestia flexa]
MFQQTIKTINREHCSTEQLDIWSGQAGWINRLEQDVTFVATIQTYIVGFITMKNDGLIDLLYVHKNFQRQGVATALLKAVEERAYTLGLTALQTEASSITAEPFFEVRGFHIVKKQLKKVQEIAYTNYYMTKSLI